MAINRRDFVASAALLGASDVLAAPRQRPAGNSRDCDVAVIGAGVFGSWTAWHLVKAGRKVALIDAYGAGHARASSGGESRVIRVSYGGDPLYSAMAHDSLRWWQAVSDRQALPLLHRTGVLWFSPQQDMYMQDSLRWLAARQIAHQRFDSAALSARFAQMRFDSLESGFLETASGLLVAGRAVQTVAREAVGTALNIAPVTGVEKNSEGDFLVAGMRARHLVFACGPWLPKLFPELLKDRIVPTRQEVYHFGARAGDARYAPPQQPVWADFNAGDIVYGMPDIEGQGFKIAFDAHGDVVDPDTLERRISEEGLQRARRYISKRFPGLAGAPLIHSRVCQYENSSNGDLLIDRHPAHDRVWLVGAGSGHGFKHGPAVGARVAAHVQDAALTVEPRFSLTTKAAMQKRSVY